MSFAEFNSQPLLAFFIGLLVAGAYFLSLLPVFVAYWQGKRIGKKNKKTYSLKDKLIDALLIIIGGAMISFVFGMYLIPFLFGGEAVIIGFSAAAFIMIISCVYGYSTANS